MKRVWQPLHSKFEVPFGAKLLDQWGYGIVFLYLSQTHYIIGLDIRVLSKVKQGVCHIQALSFTFKNILREKKN
jgi:hypothetical protein